MERNDGRTLRGSVLLLVGAIIWGVAFVAQRVGMDYVQPFTFNGVRNLIGAAVLFPVMLIMKRKEPETNEPRPEKGKMLLAGGLVCGFFLCIASNLQQFGIKYTSVGKAGFITAMYIVLVPVLGMFLGRRIGKRLWLSVGLAVIGLYLLSMTETFRLSRGDFYTLLSALAFAFQIMSVDYFAPHVNTVGLACMEFFVCGLLSLIPMFLVETPTFAGLWAARIPLLYAGVLSCGVAYTLQIVGQRDLNPAVASLIMSLEAVISALAGWLLLQQHLSRKEIAGCVLMFVAILLAQLPGGEHARDAAATQKQST